MSDCSGFERHSTESHNSWAFILKIISLLPNSVFFCHTFVSNHVRFGLDLGTVVFGRESCYIFASKSCIERIPPESYGAIYQSEIGLYLGFDHN